MLALIDVVASVTEVKLLLPLVNVPLKITVPPAKLPPTAGAVPLGVPVAPCIITTMLFKLLALTERLIDEAVLVAAGVFTVGSVSPALTPKPK